MVMVRKLIICFFLCSGIGLSQEVRLTAKTSTNTFPLGSWIDVHVEGKSDAAVDSIAPIVKDSIGSFEIVTVERKGNDFQWLIRLTTIDSGKIFLPPVEFDYKVRGDTNTHKAFTNSLLLTITGITIDPQGEIKDIKPPMSAPWLFEDFLPYLIALIVLAALAGGYYYYWRKMRQKKDIFADIKVVIPPHREALTALRVLEEKKLWQQGLVKEYYSEVTEIIRRFFKRRWNIIALEMTTDEILVQIKHVPEAMMVWKEMGSFFLTADLVKFAKYQPAPAEHEQEMHSAYEIVRSMVPKTSIETEPQSQEVTADVR
jgi:hypothetical protein